MSINLKTHKKLWGHSASRCAFDDCQKELIVDTLDLDDYFAIGDEAHIISEKVKGPRYDKDFPFEQIDKYDNLILLCKEHHTKIDSDEKYYTTDKVREVKKKHEDWVRSTLNPDPQQQKDDELFAEYIDQIEHLANFDKWVEWTTTLLDGYLTRIERQQYDNLVVLHKYISGRFYPASREDIRKAIDQFNAVLEDFINHFNLHKGEDGANKLYYNTLQLYRDKIVTIDQQTLHEHMLREFIIELTKAGNYLCDQIRKTIFAGYRLKQGILLLWDYPSKGNAYLRFLYAANEEYCGYAKIKERTKIILKQT